MKKGNSINWSLRKLDNFEIDNFESGSFRKEVPSKNVSFRKKGKFEIDNLKTRPLRKKGHFEKRVTSKKSSPRKRLISKLVKFVFDYAKKEALPKFLNS